MKKQAIGGEVFVDLHSAQAKRGPKSPPPVFKSPPPPAQKPPPLLKSLREFLGRVNKASPKTMEHHIAEFSSTAGREAGREAAKQMGQEADIIVKNVIEQVRQQVGPMADEAAHAAQKRTTRYGRKLLSQTGQVGRTAGGLALLGGAAGGAAGELNGEHRRGISRGIIGGLVGAGAVAAALPKHVGLGGKGLLPLVGGALLGGAVGGYTAGADSFGGKKKESSMSGFKYAGVILDYYDDRGETLKALFPTPDRLPDEIKTASVRPKEKLPNEAFALIMLDQGHVFRKYACADPGTTMMSSIYFMEYGDRLPEEAQKTAASNLVAACLRHNIMPPAEMTKVAEDMIPGGKADKMTDSDFPKKQMEMGQKVEMEHTDDSQKAREIARDHLEEFDDYYTRLDKMEEEAKKAKEKKAGAIKDFFLGSEKTRNKKEQEALEFARKQRAKGVKGYEYIDEGDKKKEAQVVDVTGKKPTPRVVSTRPTDENLYAVKLADGSLHYPIDTWDRVKTAEQYFQDERVRMDPEIRRQYAVKLARQAYIMGYPLDRDIAELGALSYHNDGHLKHACEMRKAAFPKGSAEHEFLDDLFEKRANVQPRVYAECLKRFDMMNGLDQGWDHVILDPWASTFGIKTAAIAWEDGADRVTEEELINLARNGAGHLHGPFTEYFALEFQKDPVALFNSLPDPQKRILARMAVDLSSVGYSEFMPTKNDDGTGLDSDKKKFKVTFGS